MSINVENYSDEVFYQAIEDKNTKKINHILKNNDINPASNNDWGFVLAAKFGALDIIKLFLKDSRINPANRDNWGIQTAVRYNHYEIVKLLLNDPRVDPAAQSNSSINISEEHNLDQITFLLFNHEKVNLELKLYDNRLYKKIHLKFLKNKVINF
jgi:hypothetical protein